MTIKRRRGEIGRHDRLKIYWGQLCIGSSPIAGKECLNPSLSGGFLFFLLHHFYG